jgi:septal ring-binding cell division protein DamX
MLNHTKILGLCLCVSGLSACTTDSPTTYTNDQPYQLYTYTGTQLYPEGYENSVYNDSTQEQKQVDIPDSYHVSVNHSPTPHADLDREWVNRQNAQSYTIELADGDKASQVAGTLYKAPKNERTAEVKYQHDGKTYYKGLYGSYPSYEAAQQALSSLPADVKQKAGIKTWSSVQNGVRE